MFVHTTYLQLSWSLKALPASPHCSSRDLVCPVIPLNVELPHKHHLLPIVTIWVPCWRCYCGMLFSGHEMDITILYQSSRDYLQGILMGADLLPLLYRESGRRVTGPSPEITVTPSLLYSPLRIDYVIISGTSKNCTGQMHLVSSLAMGGKVNWSRYLIFAVLECFQLHWGETSLWCSSLGHPHSYK